MITEEFLPKNEQDANTTTKNIKKQPKARLKLSYANEVRLGGLGECLTHV